MMLLVDGNNMCYRALYTLDLSHAGVDTSITYGVMLMLVNLLKEHKPSSMVVCFDGGTPPFRKRLLPEYKEHRQSREIDKWKDIFRQINELCYVGLPAHGVMTMRKRHCEADDLIAQAAMMAEDEVLIVSGDDDLLQCVTKTVSVYNPMKETMSTWDTMEIQSADILLYKMFCGDKSDNVSGIKGIGPKTAEKILAYLEEAGVMDYSYQSLCEIVHDLPLNNAQIAGLLNLGEERWNAMWDVMDLWSDRCGARIAVSKATWKPIDVEAVKRWYFSNGFVSLLEDNAVSLFHHLVKPKFSLGRLRTPGPYVLRTPPEEETT